MSTRLAALVSAAALLAGCGGGGDAAPEAVPASEGEAAPAAGPEPGALADCIRRSTSANSVEVSGNRVAIAWDSPLEEVDIVVAADADEAQLLVDNPATNFPGRSRIQRFDDVVVAFKSGHNQRPEHPALAKCLGIPQLDYE